MTWEQLEEKYGVKFKSDDGSFKTVDAWLAEMYAENVSSFEQLTEEVFLNGDDLFEKYLDKE